MQTLLKVTKERVCARRVVERCVGVVVVGRRGRRRVERRSWGRKARRSGVSVARNVGSCGEVLELFVVAVEGKDDE